MTDSYRERMDELIDQVHGYIDLMNLAPATRGFRVKATENDLSAIADRLDDLAKRTRETHDAYVKKKAERAEADKRIDAFMADAGARFRLEAYARSRKPEEVQ